MEWLSSVSRQQVGVIGVCILVFGVVLDTNTFVGQMDIEKVSR